MSDLIFFSLLFVSTEVWEVAISSSSGTARAISPFPSHSFRVPTLLHLKHVVTTLSSSLIFIQILATHSFTMLAAVLSVVGRGRWMH